MSVPEPRSVPESGQGFENPYPDPDGSVLRQLQALQQMTVTQLQEKHLELYGYATKSKHKQQLFKRLAWRIQELKWGGLSEEFLARLREIENDRDARYLPPRKPIHRERIVELPRPRAKGLPAVGTVLQREYGGVTHEVTIVAGGVEYQGRKFKSLSGVAREITGTNWNGKRFFGLIDARGERR